MSEVYYRSVLAVMPDASVKKVSVKAYRYDGSFAADTYFSVPAHTRVKGKYVAGYVTGYDGYDKAGPMPAYEFRVMTSHKHLLPTA